MGSEMGSDSERDGRDAGSGGVRGIKHESGDNSGEKDDGRLKMKCHTGSDMGSEVGRRCRGAEVFTQVGRHVGFAVQINCVKEYIE